ncbi:hypothetical protein B1209_12350 [Raoultella planticola]|nr:LuxR family transcriptional regulator [Raoultella planticola]ATM05370.1 hypothetical protein CRT62_12405 [Raoultella planticola]ATM17422.1 hypothetical protein CRN15_22445 [Raoultella planticola]AUV53479.1 hypothetical protein B1209_12350 [Raoultella planticola]ELU0691221.1 autoinducer binding domain-containing protein [Raoultella planticola]ELU1430639.1 autoinducer binding domain-containing protein [Raoultella planticola]
MADLIQALDVVETMSTGMMAEEYGGRVARALGFQYFHYRSAQLEMTNGPYSWSARYRQENYYQSDPIRRRAFSTRNTAVWSIGLRDRGQENWTYIEESADYGACRGVSIPVFGAYGHRASVCFSDGECNIETDGVWQAPMLHVIAALFDRSLRKSFLPCDIHLTPQEIVCLNWTSRGKTMPEIAIILGNTRRTVEFHLTNARQKLGVSSLPQAVAEALRRGIIN